jgi:hypothetical protein
MIELAAPGLMLGLLAIALPVVIHWLLRPRPRRTRFPAAVFLREALAEGRRVQRVRSVWLLLARALLIGCVALLLAAPSCPGRASLPGREDPVAGVMVLDDSLSTMYRGASEQTSFHWLCDRALDWERSAGEWPPGSTLGLVFAGFGDPVRPTTEFAAVRRGLRAATPDPHARTLAEAMQAAGRWLSESRQPAKRLVVFTDLGNHAWRQVRTGALAGIENLRVEIVAPDPVVRTNLVLEDVIGPGRIHPATAPIPLRVAVRSEAVDATGTIVVSAADGRVLLRSSDMDLRADETAYLDLLLPPLTAGFHAVAVTVEPGDRMMFDQARYVAFQTGPKPEVWLLCESESADDLATVLTANLLAPDSLAPQRQRLALKTLRESVSEADLPSGSPALIVMMSGADPPVATRAMLKALIEQGATLLLIPRSDMAVAEWAGFERRFSDTSLAVESQPAGWRMAWSPDSPFAASEDAVGDLVRAAVHRRATVGDVRAGVRTLADYDDQSPAIAALRMGQGQVILLTTSPDPQWSELGSRAAGLLAWLHALIDQRAAKPDRVLNLIAHQGDATPMAALSDGSYAVSAVGEGDRVASGVLVVRGAPEPAWPAERAGLYAVAAGNTTEAMMAINWPAEESDAAPATLEGIRHTLGTRDVVFAGELEDGTAGFGIGWAAHLTLSDWLGGLLLAFVVAEVLLARRTRKNPCASSAAGTGS